MYNKRVDEPLIDKNLTSNSLFSILLLLVKMRFNIFLRYKNIWTYFIFDYKIIKIMTKI